jgi:hypothetical protein
MVAHAVTNSSALLATFCTLAFPPPTKLPMRLPAIICFMHAPKQSTSQLNPTSRCRCPSRHQSGNLPHVSARGNTMWASDGFRAPSKQLYAGSCMQGAMQMTEHVRGADQRLPSALLLADPLMTSCLESGCPKRQKQFFKKVYPVVVTNEESVFGITIFSEGGPPATANH